MLRVLNRMRFATIQKKKQMEVTIRTPYTTIISDFSGFSRLVTKTQISTLIVQNKNPPALYILPPGPLKLRLTQDAKGFSGDLIHTGGWLIVHADNSCEVNLMDCFERKEIRPELIDKVQIKEADTLSTKYISRFRKATSKLIAKKAIS